MQTGSVLKYKVMTPGPTRVAENVRMARSFETTNPDLDMDFFEYYMETCDKLSRLMHTKNQALILGGEGILGLEAACASLTEEGDRVLVIENGVFGKGFGEFVEMYGGKAVYFSGDYHNPIDVAALKEFLKGDSSFKYATLVHCDTPSGVLNDIQEICKLLKSQGILTVVDSVAGMFGEYVNVDESHIDILCGGSQKALSAPPGLTMLWVSKDAFDSMKARKTPIRAFYANILLFKDYYEKKAFPYTMPISDIYGLRAAVENAEKDGDILERHRKIAEAVRASIEKAGLELFLESGHANTVTVFRVPKGLTDRQILETMKADYGIMMAGSFDVMAGKVIRIGHMGENAREDFLEEVLAAIDGTLRILGMELKVNMKEEFIKNYNK